MTLHTEAFWLTKHQAPAQLMFWPSPCVAISVQVYVHHYVSSYLFLLGNGAELRGSFTRKPLPEPYALVVNGSFVADVRQRLTNIQLINTGAAGIAIHPP